MREGQGSGLATKSPRLLAYTPRWGARVWLLFLGLLVAGSAFGLFLSSSSTLFAVAQADLDRFWQTSYDLLVLPPEQELAVNQGRVRPNVLTGWRGGIGFDQWNAIRDIPDVAVAAPIAVLGNVFFSLPGRGVGSMITEPGLYRYVTTRYLAGQPWKDSRTSVTYCLVYPSGGALQQSGLTQGRIHLPSGVSCRNDGILVPDAAGSFLFEPLLVAVDPASEDALVGLRHAFRSGWLGGADAPEPIAPGSPGLLNWKGLALEIPVAINISPFIEGSVQITVEKVDTQAISAGDPADLLDQVAARGGRAYLDSLPRSSVLTRRHTTEDFYTMYNEGLALVTGPAWISTGLYNPAGPVEYEAAEPLGERAVLAARPVAADETQVLFRRLERPSAPREAVLHLKGVGIFSIADLGLAGGGPTAVPQDNYFPPVADLVYDAQGRPLPEPVTLRPGTDVRGYLQQPPSLLTTMEAARMIRGEKAISSVRVRVAGAETYSPEAQSKLERVAAEIVRRTGLRVVITAGASPEKALVYLPGYADLPAAGYVEEWWSRPGVNVAIRDRVQWENLIFFVIVLVVGALYIGNTALVTTLQRWSELGLLKALGWRETTVAGRVLGQFLGPALVAGLAGVFLSQGVAGLLGMRLSLRQALVVAPVSLLLGAVGACAGLAVVRRSSAISAIRGGGISAPGSSAGTGRARAPRRAVRGRRRLTALWSMAWNGLALRPATTIVNVAVIGVASGFLVLVVTVLRAARGYLSGTFLGSYILVHIESYHVAMAVTALLLAVIAAADAALVGVLLRRGQLGLLAAVGWTPATLRRLVFAEGFLLGAMGAGLGLVLGVTAALVLTGGGVVRTLVACLPAVLATLCVIPLSMTAAAGRAARLPPAEVLRGE
jgi:hypothetical protein